MTHTEESLMALAYLTQFDGYDALNFAIREVLAERDALGPFMRSQVARAEKAEAELAFKAALVHELLPYQERAVKAEAEAERLRELIAELDGHEGAEGWSEGIRGRIDAALKDQP